MKPKKIKFRCWGRKLGKETNSMSAPFELEVWKVASGTAVHSSTVTDFTDTNVTANDIIGGLFKIDMPQNPKLLK